MNQSDAAVQGLPDYEALWETGFVLRETAADEWHKEPSVGPDGVIRWYWHASQLDKCPRALILQRAGLYQDDISLDGHMAMEVGNTFHQLTEDFLNDVNAAAKLGDNIEVISVERGGAHNTLPLRAKPDHILRCNDAVIVCDVKSEAGSAVKMRKMAQKQTQAFDAVRPEHKRQITAGAIVAEDLSMYEGQARTGLVVYISRQISKNKWDFSVESFEITAQMRTDVLNRIDFLEDAWEEFCASHIVPSCLPNEIRFGKVVPNWLCARHTEKLDELVGALS